VAAEDFPEDFHEELYCLAQESVTVAIGEVGIDFVDNVFTGVTYHDNPTLRNAQEHAFRKQIALACEVSLPLITHCRGAYESFIPILAEEGANIAKQLLDMGFLLSFGGTITYPDQTALREAVRQIPLDGILLETDSPYMPLYQQTTEQNEPAHVAQVASTLAEIKGIDVGELIEAVYANFTRLLKLTDQKAV
jgi:TatD DNase family protein